MRYSRIVLLEKIYPDVWQVCVLKDLIKLCRLIFKSKIEHLYTMTKFEAVLEKDFID